MAQDETYKTLTEIFHDVFMRDDIVLTPQLTAKDVTGWDSFKQIELLIAIEEKYGVTFRTRELEGFHNVGDLAAAVESKLAAR